MEKEIIITVSAPVECTDEQFQEWAEFCLGFTGGISRDNPLHEYDLEASEIDVR
jgi:zinc transporter ZupT